MRNRLNHHRLAISSLVLLGCLFGHSTRASDEAHDLRVQISRYITLEPTTTIEQRLPLLQANDIRLPRNVTWLRTALIHVLQGSGYDLAPDVAQSPEIRALFQRNVAEIQREFKQVTVLEALHALAGPAFVIRLDPVARLIAFELAPAFRTPVIFDTVLPVSESLIVKPLPPAVTFPYPE